jgi:hypothetical protein
MQEPTLRPRHRRIVLIRWLLWITLAGFIAYTYDSSGQVIGFGGGPAITCAGGLFSIVLFGCDTGVPDVDCGNNDGCLAGLLAHCESQVHSFAGYQTCILQVTTKCMANGKLAPSGQGHIWGCAATAAAFNGK